MPKFKVVAGKHNMRDEKGNLTYVRQGGTLELSKAEAAKFPGKFEPVDESTAVSSPESTSGSAVPGGEPSAAEAAPTGTPSAAGAPAPAPAVAAPAAKVAPTKK